MYDLFAHSYSSYKNRAICTVRGGKYKDAPSFYVFHVNIAGTILRVENYK